jgi:hypothetical protein
VRRSTPPSRNAEFRGAFVGDVTLSQDLERSFRSASPQEGFFLLWDGKGGGGARAEVALLRVEDGHVGGGRHLRGWRHVAQHRLLSLRGGAVHQRRLHTDRAQSRCRQRTQGGEKRPVERGRSTSLAEEHQLRSQERRRRNVADGGWQWGETGAQLLQHISRAVCLAHCLQRTVR